MARSDDSLESVALRLSECIAESHQAYRDLLSLEKQQADFIRRGDLEKTAEKIDAKKTLLEKIEILTKDLHSQHTAWQAVRENAPDSLRNRLQEQVNGLQAVMAEILEIQKTNEQSLTRHSKEINEKLIELRKKRTAHKQYQQQRAGDAYGRSKFYDKNT